MSHKEIPVIFESVKKSKNRYLSTSLYNIKKETTDFLHYHDVLEIGLCLKGSGELLTSDGTFPFSKGDVQFILPFQPHYNINHTDDTLWAFINIDVPRISSPHLSPDTAFLIDLVGKIQTGGIFHKDESPSVSTLISDIADLAVSDAAEQSAVTDLITANLIALLLEMSMTEIKNAVLTENKKRSAIILPAIKLVSNELENRQAVTAEQMANACFISQSHFRKIFVSIMGESPKSYILRMQLQKATHLLLSSDISVSQIAMSCGFNDNSTFYRRFVNMYGMSPTEYRKKWKAQ